MVTDFSDSSQSEDKNQRPQRGFFWSSWGSGEARKGCRNGERLNRVQALEAGETAEVTAPPQLTCFYWHVPMLGFSEIGASSSGSSPDETELPR